MKNDECSWCHGVIHKIEIPEPEVKGEKSKKKPGILRVVPLFLDNSLTYHICDSCLRRELYLASTRTQKPLDSQREYMGVWP